MSLTDPRRFRRRHAGLFRLKQDGLAQHGLAVLEVADGGVREIEPTPTRFEDELVESPFFCGGLGIPNPFEDPRGQGRNANPNPPLTQ